MLLKKSDNRVSLSNVTDTFLFCTDKTYIINESKTQACARRIKLFSWIILKALCISSYGFQDSLFILSKSKKFFLHSSIISWVVPKLKSELSLLITIGNWLLFWCWKKYRWKFILSLIGGFSVLFLLSCG